jgi:hypothetical protein
LAILVMAALLGSIAPAAFSAGAQQAAAQTARAVIGAIKTIRGNTVIIAPDTGADVTVTVQPTLRIRRVAPGETNMANAVPMQFTDLQVGDRVLVRGTPAPDGQSLTATSVVAMKRAELDARQEQERLDWQRRGIGGLVSTVDSATGIVTISTSAAGVSRTMAVQTTANTVVRRYAPDSVRFDDARASNLGQVKTGDQLRARGTRSADGSTFAAEEVVVGSFRNISGTIETVDATANSITVNDLATKQPVVVRITNQSQVTKLTPEAAQGVAARTTAATGRGRAGGDAVGAGRRGGGEATGAGRGPGGGQGDLQQVISRMPPATLADFQKGGAVMVVSTEGTAAGVTAILLVGGVEPILTAAPEEQMNLSPWNVDGGDGDGGP